MSSWSQAAVLADEFFLTHKNVCSLTLNEKSLGLATPSVQPQADCTKASPFTATENCECFYCHKAGYVIADCFALKRKMQQQPDSSKQSKPAGLIKTLPAPPEIVATVSCSPDPSYGPFIFPGLFLLSGKPEDQMPVKILKDTGAAQSFMLTDVLPLSDQSSGGSNVMVQGIKMGFVLVPLHHVHLHCDLVTGFFWVGVHSTLPVKGITFILGNITVGKVMPVLEVLDVPVVHSPVDTLTEIFRRIFLHVRLRWHSPVNLETWWSWLILFSHRCSQRKRQRLLASHWLVLKLLAGMCRQKRQSLVWVHHSCRS